MNKYYHYLDQFPSLEGKVAIVTGANSGLGYKTTISLAYKKAHVIMACRNIKKAEDAKNKILKEIPAAQLTIIQYDQSSFESIIKFCSEINDNFDKIDYLICNAGVYFQKKKVTTNDGFEMTFGTNYIGTFYLLNQFLSFLEYLNCKVIVVTSLTGFLTRRNIDVLDNEKYTRNTIYGFSKQCLTRLACELNFNQKINIYLTHPGICKTNIISSEGSGLPNWFSKLGRGFLDIFVHSASKASLTNIFTIFYEGNKKYVCPRGIFHISGYPKEYYYPQYAKKPIIEETYRYLRSRNIHIDENLK